MIKKVIAFVCTLCMLPSAVPVSAEEKQVGPLDRVYEMDGYNVNTPEENIFRIDGSSKEFVLLDDEDGFLVLAKDGYGKRAFDSDGTQKFDPEDKNNIAYWLNNDFIESGNGVGNKLPAEIIKYLEDGHEWFTEGGFPSGNCPKDYSVNCKIALMSQSEWIKYIDKFGVDDGIGVYGWWLRTARGKNGTTGTVLCSMTTAERIGQTFGQESVNSSQYYVRPVFYISGEFFKNVRLDKIGANVGEAMARHFSKEDFQGEGALNYGDKFLRSIGFDIPFEINDGMAKVKADILKGEYDFSLAGKSSKEKIICGEEQFVKTGYAVNSRKNYELILSAQTDGLPQADGAVLYCEYFDGDGAKVGGKNEILKIGGTRKNEEYVSNLVNIPQKTDFVIFTLYFKEGLSGSVNFGGLRLREVNPKIEIKNEWEPLYIINPDSDFYVVNIECATTLPKVFTTYYRLKYKTDGFVYESAAEKLTLTSLGEKSYRIGMKNLHRGTAELSIYVKFGNNVVKTFTREVTVCEKFDWSTDNTLLKHGICTHPAQIERSKGVILDYVKQAGFNYIRADFSWERLEKGAKGAYDYSALDYIMQEINKRGMHLMAILCYSNKLYTQNSKSGIADNETLDAFLKYVKTVAKRYPEIKYFEVWNEPNNNGFWYPKANVNDYANFVKAVSNAVKEVRPDAYVVGGAIDISKNGPGWSRELFDLDIYPYIDAFSTHPYYHVALNDAKFLDRVRNYTDITEDYGGWKDVYLSEAGWTTYGKKELEPTLAKEDIKILINADYLDTRVNLFNMWDEGETFGLLNPDYSAKASFAAVENYKSKTAGAQFLTEINLNNNCRTMMYRKNNLPMLISWCFSGESAVIEFPEAVKVYDMYGNFISEGKKVYQTDEPYYIYVSDTEFMKNEIKRRIESDINEFEKKYLLSQEIKAALKSQKLDLTSKNQADEEDLDAFYNLGIEIMKFLGDDLFEHKNTNMMHAYHKIGMEIADFVSLGGKKCSNASEAEVNKAKKDYSEKTNNSSDELRFGYELLRNAEKYSLLAKQTSESANVESGAANAFDCISKNLVKWFEFEAEFEKCENRGVHFQVIPGTVESYEGENSVLSVRIYNDGSADAVGKAAIKNADGDVIAESDNVTVSGRSKENLKFVLNSEMIGKDNDFLTISFDGNMHAETKMKSNIKSKISITSVNSEKPAGEITSLKVTLENKTDTPQSGFIKVTPPEGWSVGERQSFELNELETKDISIPVSRIERKAFNHYVFTFEIYSDSQKLISKAQMPLDFSVIVKADKEINPTEFNGNISDWSDAYPTYLNPPIDPNSHEKWENSDISGRIFTKWDDNYFYLLADIYDDYQNQMNHEGLIYDGDSLQLAFDTKNTKSGKYDSDDYEYGFALTQSGEESYSWQAAEGNSSGTQPPEWSRILRDDENKNTRYLIRIPKDALKPMDFSEGSVIGFNLAANDGNLLGPREGYVEITPGIASSKNTALFRDWVLSASEERTESGMAEISKVFASEMGIKEDIFSDIGGHWAESAIREAYAKKLVSGMGNKTYAPNGTLTTAQAFSLAARSFGIGEDKCTFDDAAPDKWYSGIIGGMESGGFVPGFMLCDNKINPERNITREEFAAIIASGIKGGESNLEFADSDAISPQAADAVKKVSSVGIMIGDENNRFNPQGCLTRAEAAVIVLKLSNM